MNGSEEREPTRQETDWLTHRRSLHLVEPRNQLISLAAKVRKVDLSPVTRRLDILTFRDDIKRVGTKRSAAVAVLD